MGNIGNAVFVLAFEKAITRAIFQFNCDIWQLGSAEQRDKLSSVISLLADFYTDNTGMR